MTSRYHDNLPQLGCLRDQPRGLAVPLQGNQVVRLDRSERLMRARGLPHHHENLTSDAHMVLGLRPEIGHSLDGTKDVTRRARADRNSFRPKRKGGGILALIDRKSTRLN